MNEQHEFVTLANAVKDIHLSEEEKSSARTNIILLMEKASLAGQLVPTAQKLFWRPQNLFISLRAFAFTFTVLFICLMSGILFATARSQPGDWLYPVKKAVDRQWRFLRSLARRRTEKTVPPINKPVVSAPDISTTKQTLVGLETTIASTFRDTPISVRFTTTNGDEVASIAHAIQEIDAFITKNKPFLPLLPPASQEQIRLAYEAYDDGKHYLEKKDYTAANGSFRKAIQVMQSVTIDPAALPNLNGNLSTTTIQLIQNLTNSP